MNSDHRQSVEQTKKDPGSSRDQLSQDQELWICPNCKTKNYGRKCGICGTYRDAPIICKCGQQNSGTCQFCSACGAPLGQKKKSAKPAVLTTVIAVVLLLVIGFFTVHIWTEASCTEPSVCRICGKERTAALGHKWRKATCFEPETCETCGATRGTTLDHQWEPATCSVPETCETCGATRGMPLAHQWERATFLTPKTCGVCGAAEGTAVPYEDIDVYEYVLFVREIYETVSEQRKDGTLQKKEIQRGVYAYYDQNYRIRYLVVSRGTEGIGQYSQDYSRSYLFRDNALIFAFYEGSDQHRFYFYDELLVRWKYTNAAGSSYYDLEFSDAYFSWESTVVDEVYSILNRK